MVYGSTLASPESSTVRSSMRFAFSALVSFGGVVLCVAPALGVPCWWGGGLGVSW